MSSPTEGRKLVMVEWRDIESHATWKTIEEAMKHEPATCHDVGWILRMDETALTLFRSSNNGGEVGDLTVLPLGCVVKITPLVEAPKKRAKR